MRDLLHLLMPLMVYSRTKKLGLVRDLNPGPLAPKARIMPLDQRADASKHITRPVYVNIVYWRIVARILPRSSSRSMAFRVVGLLRECICLCLFVLLFTCFRTLPRYK